MGIQNITRKDGLATGGGGNCCAFQNERGSVKSQVPRQEFPPGKIRGESATSEGRSYVKEIDKHVLGRILTGGQEGRSGGWCAGGA